MNGAGRRYCFPVKGLRKFHDRSYFRESLCFPVL